MKSLLELGQHAQYPFVSCRVWLFGLSFPRVCVCFYFVLLFYTMVNLPVELMEDIFQHLDFE